MLPTGASQRNKTRRAGSPSTTAAGGGSEVVADPAEQYGLNTGLEQFLNLNASNAYKRQWHRLERGLRLNRIRRFIEAETARMKLSTIDVENLTNLLHKALDKKLLNSKNSVIYDPEKEEIQEIKGLVYHRAADGKIVSQIVEKKSNNMTVRRRKTDSVMNKNETTSAVAPETTTSLS